MKKAFRIALTVAFAFALLPGCSSANGDRASSSVYSTHAENPTGSGDSAEATRNANGEDSPGDASSAVDEGTAQLQRLSDMVLSFTAPIANIPDEDLFARHYYWSAVENQNFDSANEDGSLSEWQQDWYISHDWSDYGMAIADLKPGDAVTVDDATILILGREQWPKESINWDVFDAIGWDKTVFQTCLGDDAIWIAYGIPVYPTQDFLESHATC